MAQIWFDPGTLTVSCGPETATLLAKEYALLRFLYDRRGQVFSREQLLDHVWPGQYPDERTVDDHVYRLRRKLARLPQLAVATVRGCGYSLRLKEAPAAPNPSVLDEEIRSSVQGLFRKYHLYGQGRSMLTLAAQQDALGIEVDAFYGVYLRFIQGDLAWFLHTDDAPAADRLYWVLLFYAYLADPRDSLARFERALELQVLAPDQRRELYILNIVDLYADTGRIAEAEARLAVAREVVERDDLTAGFAMPVALAELYVRIVKGDLEAAASGMEALERMLADAPYLREIGRFHLLRAMYLLRSCRTKEAAQAVDAGLHVLRQSENVPLLLQSVRQLLLGLDRPPAGQADAMPVAKPDARRAALRRKLEAQRAELEREHGYGELLGEARALLERCLT
ncbi:winged helix-turn-helix transcriptional regulator [Paenibacillus sp. MWE-103]|uniref:Winged helix-turn-helix transcriptional regulator n=1 Tax=Paenibacillus artemisiicola TaxID=1172618 RepID=A0ABS3W4T3_9BACL|nr:winged helix-turn-helix domain-containing protein [Paenibacillus artemisiicola]MBO7743300.1 winged helix-turn-helix transcriptional regulator [Paenibacillus artemisiicola]